MAGEEERRQKLREFLEESPLHKKLDLVLAADLSEAWPPIRMECHRCKGTQTFTYHALGEGTIPTYQRQPKTEYIQLLRYRCAACQEALRFFLLRMAGDEHGPVKVGQDPPWSIHVDKELERALGESENEYRKGLASEASGYGMGACAYYRRIVENLIDNLLDEIETLIPDGAEKQSYQRALVEVKKTRQTDEKVRLVKDLIPPILRPGGYNPLSILHSELSEGIHTLSEQECMDSAELIRKSLQFLVKQLDEAKGTSKEFTKGLKTLLDKKAARSTK